MEESKNTDSTFSRCLPIPIRELLPWGSSDCFIRSMIVGAAKSQFGWVADSLPRWVSRWFLKMSGSHFVRWKATVELDRFCIRTLDERCLNGGPTTRVQFMPWADISPTSSARAPWKWQKVRFPMALKMTIGTACVNRMVCDARLAPFSLLKYETLPHFKISTFNSKGRSGRVTHYFCLIWDLGGIIISTSKRLEGPLWE